MINNDTVTADYYNNIQRRKWQSPDLNSKKHNFLTVSPKYHGSLIIFLGNTPNNTHTQYLPIHNNN